MMPPSTMAPSAIQYTQPPVSRLGDCVGLMLTWASATCGSAITASIAVAIGSSSRSTRGWREDIAAILAGRALPGRGLSDREGPRAGARRLGLTQMQHAGRSPAPGVATIGA